MEQIQGKWAFVLTLIYALTQYKQIREFLFPSFAQPLNPISHERGVFRTLSNFAASRDPIQLHELKCCIMLKNVFSVSATSIQVIIREDK